MYGYEVSVVIGRLNDVMCIIILCLVVTMFKIIMTSLCIEKAEVSIPCLHGGQHWHDGAGLTVKIFSSNSQIDISTSTYF